MFLFCSYMLLLVYRYYQSVSLPIDCANVSYNNPYIELCFLYYFIKQKQLSLHL